MPARGQKQYRPIIFAVSAGVLAFAFDLMLPLGPFSGFSYLPLVFAGWWLAQWQGYLILALASGGLSAIAHHLPVGGAETGEIEARIGAFSILFAVAAMLAFAKKSREARVAELAARDERHAQQTAQLRKEAQARRQAVADAKAAKEEAVASERAKNKLIANISHDLRTPLNNVIGFSELIISKVFGPGDTEKLREYIFDIHKSGKELLEFIDDAIDLSRLEGAVLQENGNYQDLVDLAPDLICECHDGIVTNINTAGTNILGKTGQTNIVGRHFVELVHPDSRTALENDFNAILTDKPRIPMKFLHENGHHIEMEVSALNLGQGPDGRLMIVARDVTDRLLADQERKRLETRMRHSQKLETIGTLAGGIAHDFNNILTPIFGYLHMAMQDVPQDSQTHKDLTHVMKAAQRCKDLVQQILTFSRQDEQEIRPVQVHLVVKEVLKLLRGSIPATIEIRQNLDTTCPAVLADPSQIHQVLMNLCTNAAQSMANGGGILEVTLGMYDIDRTNAEEIHVLAEGPHLKLSVKDTGCGMDTATLNRVFEPFFTTRFPGEGTGMGLSVVHGIVVNHGGNVTVESQAGKGAEFTVYLPATGRDVEQDTQSDEPTRIGKGRVLFVDDDQEITEMAKQMLERLGYSVLAETDSSRALDNFKSNPDNFDLVITDLTMPHIDGISLAREITAVRAGLPVILISGFDEAISEEEKQTSGICDSIKKPMRARDLSVAVWRAMEGAQ